MKKTFKKELSLNKRTISDLDQEEKRSIKGGTTVFVETCYCYTEHKSCSLGVNCCPPPEGKMAQTLDC